MVLIEFMCIMGLRKVLLFNLVGKMGLLKDFCERRGRVIIVGILWVDSWVTMCGIVLVRF